MQVEWEEVENLNATIAIVGEFPALPLQFKVR